MKCVKSIVVIVVFCTSLCGKQKIDRTHEKLFAQHVQEMSHGDVWYLLGYPRSGSTLTRYITEFVTQRPTMGVRVHPKKFDSPLGLSFSALPTDITLRPIWKIHMCPDITHKSFYDPKKTKLIVLVRNYKELAFRYQRFNKRITLFSPDNTINESSMQKVFDHFADKKAQDMYFANIELYDTIPATNRLLIYYEDLIERPEQVIYDIAKFLHADLRHADAMIAHLPECKKNILSFYNVHQSSLSRGQDARYYSKKESYERCCLIDEWVKKHTPYVWHTYLARYDECNFRTS